MSVFCLLFDLFCFCFISSLLFCVWREYPWSHASFVPNPDWKIMLVFLLTVKDSDEGWVGGGVKHKGRQSPIISPSSFWCPLHIDEEQTMLGCSLTLTDRDMQSSSSQNRSNCLLLSQLIVGRKRRFHFSFFSFRSTGFLWHLYVSYLHSWHERPCKHTMLDILTWGWSAWMSNHCCSACCCAFLFAFAKFV